MLETVQRCWTIHYLALLKHALLLFCKVGKPLTLSDSFSHLYDERVVRDASFHLSVGTCMKANLSTYEDFGFERLNLSLSFLAEWRSSCSCRLFWGTAAMILKNEGEKYQWNCMLCINHNIYCSNCAQSNETFFGQNLFWHLKQVTFEIHNL